MFFLGFVAGIFVGSFLLHMAYQWLGPEVMFDDTACQPAPTPGWRELTSDQIYDLADKHPVKRGLWTEHLDFAEAVQDAVRLNQCPPCSGNCDQGRRCPGRRAV